MQKDQISTLWFTRLVFELTQSSFMLEATLRKLLELLELKEAAIMIYKAEGLKLHTLHSNFQLESIGTNIKISEEFDKAITEVITNTEDSEGYPTYAK